MHHSKKRKTKFKLRSYFKGAIDIWSVPHFLFGTVTSMFALVWHIPLLPTLVITLLLAMLWEFVERKTGLKEKRYNIASDLALPLLACFITFIFVAPLATDPDHQSDLFIVSVILYVTVTWFAWEARLDHEAGFSG